MVDLVEGWPGKEGLGTVGPGTVGSGSGTLVGVGPGTVWLGP